MNAYIYEIFLRYIKAKLYDSGIVTLTLVSIGQQLISIIAATTKGSREVDTDLFTVVISSSTLIDIYTEDTGSLHGNIYKNTVLTKEHL